MDNRLPHQQATFEASGLLLRWWYAAWGPFSGWCCIPSFLASKTSAFRCITTNYHLQNFSVDTAIIVCVSKRNNVDHGKVLSDFVIWCQLNHLYINTSKTKEIMINLWRKPYTIAPMNIHSLGIEVVDRYKYVGFHLNNKLDWSHDTHALYMNSQSWLYLQADWGLLGSAGHCWGSSVPLWWFLPPFMRLSAGEVAACSGTGNG